MLIRTTLIAATAAIGLTGAAMADGAKGPTILSDLELATVVAGTGWFAGDTRPPGATRCVTRR